MLAKLIIFTTIISPTHTCISYTYALWALESSLTCYICTNIYTFALLADKSICTSYVHASILAFFIIAKLVWFTHTVICAVAGLGNTQALFADWTLWAFNLWAWSIWVADPVSACMILWADRMGTIRQACSIHTRQIQWAISLTLASFICYALSINAYIARRASDQCTFSQAFAHVAHIPMRTIIIVSAETSRRDTSTLFALVVVRADYIYAGIDTLVI